MLQLLQLWTVVTWFKLGQRRHLLRPTQKLTQMMGFPGQIIHLDAVSLSQCMPNSFMYFTSVKCVIFYGTLFKANFFLISSLFRIAHFAHQSDIQMAAMLCCTFSPRSDHQDNNRFKSTLCKAVNVSVSTIKEDLVCFSPTLAFNLTLPATHSFTGLIHFTLSLLCLYPITFLWLRGLWEHYKFSFLSFNAL